MGRREFLQLAQPYEGQRVGGWFWSVKLDGQRAYWDGGLSRGMLASDVPWANVSADGRYVDSPVSTGLWSRYSKTIQAPAWWTDQLPGVGLDVELYMGRGGFQLLRSTVSNLKPDFRWHDVVAHILDVPSHAQVFQDGHVKAPAAHWDWVCEWRVVRAWLEKAGVTVSATSATFMDSVVAMRALGGGKNWRVHPQERLPEDDDEAAAVVERETRKEVSLGGEGLVLRNPYRVWVPKRVDSVLKSKPSLDSEGTVTGFSWGKRTDRGSRHLGRMGALRVSWRGKTFELSGFTDAERAVTGLEGADVAEGEKMEGREASNKWTVDSFPRGAVVTFTYRELTDAGIPKEARFLRVRSPE